jgi:hypothetical protein
MRRECPVRCSVDDPLIIRIHGRRRNTVGAFLPVKLTGSPCQPLGSDNGPQPAQDQAWLPANRAISSLTHRIVRPNDGGQVEGLCYGANAVVHVTVRRPPGESTYQSVAVRHEPVLRMVAGQDSPTLRGYSEEILDGLAGIPQLGKGFFIAQRGHVPGND